MRINDTQDYLIDCKELVEMVLGGKEYLLEYISGSEGDKPAKRLPWESNKIIISQRASGLVTAFSMIKEARIYSSVFPRQRLLIDNYIGRTDWLRYHHTSFLTAMVSVADCTAYLLNDCFGLIRPQRFVTVANVAKELPSGHSGSRKRLLAIDKYVAEERPHRNAETHQMQRRHASEIVGDRFLDQVSIMETVLRIGNLKDDEIREFRSVTQEAGRHLGECLAEHYHERALGLAELVSGLVCELYPTYRSIIEDPVEKVMRRRVSGYSKTGD